MAKVKTKLTSKQFSTMIGDVSKICAEHPYLRKGQAFMSLLSERFPSVSDYYDALIDEDIGKDVWEWKDSDAIYQLLCSELVE